MENPILSELGSLFRGEISSVETYTQALDKIDDDDKRIASQLELCRASHLQRAEALKRKIEALGGHASQGSGVWGGFARLIEGGASVFGTKAAIAALEQGEDHGRDDYKRAVQKLHGDESAFVAGLLAEQQKTHDTLSALKRTLH